MAECGDATSEAFGLAPSVRNGRYVCEKLSTGGRARRENKQRCKWKSNAYLRNEGKGSTDDNGKNEPKRD